MRIEINKSDILRINKELYICNNGAKFSHLNNNMGHNVDGPAYEHNNGSETWYSDGMSHRKYGPASKWNDGDESWWIYGKNIR